MTLLCVLIKKVLFRLLSPWLIVQRGARKGSSIALTFDDGPNPHFTPSVLELLKENQAKATFFLLGDKVASFPDLAQKIVADGHEIASHSFHHHPLRGKSYFDVKHELDCAEESLKPFRRETTWKLLRPPYGTLSLPLLVWAWRYRRKIILWSKDPEDFSAQSVSDLLRFFKEHPIVPGDIILLHDQSDVTVDLLRTLLPQLRQEGLKMVGVNDLLDALSG